jgi:hypothetical protein
MDAKGNARLANKYGEFVVSAPKGATIIITKDSNDIRNERASGGYILQVAGESGYFGEMDRMYSPETLKAMEEYRKSHEVEKDSNESDGSYEVKKANTDVLPGALGLGSLLEGMLSSGSAVSGFGVIYIPIPDKVRVDPYTSDDTADDPADVEWNPDAGENLNDVDTNHLPEGWKKDTPPSGRIHIKDTNGVERLRFDPPANGANGHWHYFDGSGIPLDMNGNPTYKGAPNSHIYTR